MTLQQTEGNWLVSLQAPLKTVLSTEIYNNLHGAILSGTIDPGTRIVEESLARQLGVSRAPLREAIWMLKRDGLLYEESPRSTRVISLEEEDIRELHLIRTVLETVAYQHAAPLLTLAEVEELEAIVQEMQVAGSSGDSSRLADLDYEFHKRLCGASALPRVYRIWDEQHVLFRLWLNVVARAHDGDVDEIVLSHRDLLTAITSQDNRAIAKQTLRHVYNVGSALAEKRAQWAKQAPQIGMD
jgi:DNA-binding GntR family transcriptional regulator